MDAGRHLFSTGPGVYGVGVTEYGTPARHTLVQGCTATNMGNHAFSEHEASRHLTYLGCKAYNSSLRGWFVRGVDTHITDFEASNLVAEGIDISPGATGCVIENGTIQRTADFGINVEEPARIKNVIIEDTVFAGVNVISTGAGTVLDRVRCYRTESGGSAGTKRGFAISAQVSLIDCYAEDVDRGVRYSSVTGIIERRFRGKTCTNLRNLSGTNTFTEFEPLANAAPDTQVLVSGGSFTLTIEGPTYTVQPVALSADRTCTLSTTGAIVGMRKRITRTVASTGAFNLGVGSGPLKNLATGQWCEVTYDGSAWVLTAYGAL
jgi:hypothetical protein